MNFDERLGLVFGEDRLEEGEREASWLVFYINPRSSEARQEADEHGYIWDGDEDRGDKIGSPLVFLAIEGNNITPTVQCSYFADGGKSFIDILGDKTPSELEGLVGRLFVSQPEILRALKNAMMLLKQESLPDPVHDPVPPDVSSSRLSDRDEWDEADDINWPLFAVNFKVFGSGVIQT